MVASLKQTMPVRATRYFIRKLIEHRRSCKWENPSNVFMQKNQEKLEALRGKHQGEPCVIIGGGPSINKMDLNEFKDCVTIACNGFYLKFDDIDFVPTYYTVEDPLPAEDNQIEINAIKNSTKIIPYDLRDVLKPDDNTVYINFLRSYMRPSNSSFPLFSNDCAKQCYWGGTVLYMNIQLAYYLGCNPIYLIGVDLNYKIPNTVKKNGAILLSTEDDMNHFHPNYFGEGKRWHLPEMDRMQKSFTTAYEHLKSQGIQLVNAGIDSQLKDVPIQRFNNEK